MKKKDTPMKLLTRILVWLAVAGGAFAATPLTRTIPVSDTNWFFSPYNWYVNDSAFAETQNTGAYFTLRFTGTQVALVLDVSPLNGVSVLDWPKIRWQIDSSLPEDHRLKQSDSQLRLNSQALAPGPHSLMVWFVSSSTFHDRWIVPVESVRITGLVIDVDGSILAPVLYPARMLFFGDSITEGINTESAKPQGVVRSDATHAYTYGCAAALKAEFGVVGFAGQGWTVALGEAGQHVPPFPEAWKYQFAGQPRSFSPAPDYVVVVHGGGDGLVGIPDPQVADAVQVWLGNARAALRKSKIFVVVPFGGWERDGVAQGFNAYQEGAHDRNAYLIDLGPSAQVGLDGGFVQGGTATSYDGVHPTAARSAELGAMLAEAIKEALGE